MIICSGVRSGPDGLCEVAGAKLMGATKIIGVDTVPERLAMARKLGADHVIDFRATEPVAEILSITAGGSLTLQLRRSALSKL